MRTWYQDDYVGGFIDENGHLTSVKSITSRMQILINMLWKCRTMMAIMIPTAIM